jgi:hypothetical protein
MSRISDYRWSNGFSGQSKCDPRGATMGLRTGAFTGAQPTESHPGRGSGWAGSGALGLPQASTREQLLAG